MAKKKSTDKKKKKGDNKKKKTKKDVNLASAIPSNAINVEVPGAGLEALVRVTEDDDGDVISSTISACGTFTLATGARVSRVMANIYDIGATLPSDPTTATGVVFGTLIGPRRWDFRIGTLNEIPNARFDPSTSSNNLLVVSAIFEQSFTDDDDKETTSIVPTTIQVTVEFIGVKSTRTDLDP